MRWPKLLHLFSQRKLVGVVLAVLVAISLMVRWTFVKNGHFVFWFDQARDVIVAGEMWKNPDFKLMGPSASGTGDMVYHGVLYYYVIAPWYGLFGGNPQAPAMALGAITSLALIGYYFLVKTVTRSSLLGLLTVGLLAISAQSGVLSIWLANTTLAIPIFPFFYLSLWQVFFAHKRGWWLVMLGVSYGLLIQAGLWMSAFGIVIAVAWLIELQLDRAKAMQLWRPKWLLMFGLPVILLISSILLVQFRLWQVGIFSLDKFLFYSNQHSVADLDLLLSVLKLYGKRMVEIGFSASSILTLLVGLLLLPLGRKLDRETKLFYGLLLASPLLISLLQPRSYYSYFLGFDYVLLMVAVHTLSKAAWEGKRLIWLGLIALFVLSQFSFTKYLISSHDTLIDTFKTTYGDQLGLVNFTYEKADGLNFSMASFTDPHATNTVWAYLYSWYGQQRYGYVPSFIGPSQVGTIHAALLPESQVADAWHFAIMQPNNTMPETYQADFLSQQQRVSSVPATGFNWFGQNKLYTFSEQDYQLKQQQATMSGMATNN